MTFSSVVISASGEARMIRVGALSPYAIEVVAEDALRLGPGARLEIAVTPSDAKHLAAVRRRFAWLGRRGIAVAVRRSDPGFRLSAA